MFIRLKKCILQFIELKNQYLRIRRYNTLTKMGLNPFIHIEPNNQKYTLREARNLLITNQFLVPNVSGFYHNILQIFWNKYGLGEKCLLVSETKSVGIVFKKKYPKTEFITTDFYLDLQPNPECDVVWDLCSLNIPNNLSEFTSIVNQATLEHIKDPVQVVRNLVKILNENSYLYLQTHTPAFYYHGYPKDYLRYFPDWFIDLPQSIENIHLVELLCFDGHAFAVYKKGKYIKN